MKYVPVVLASALALYVAAAPASAADETKQVKGTVTAVAGDTVTVQVADKTMNFKVDSKNTLIEGRGASTATRQAQAAGAAGAKLTDLIKVGQGVEVHYKEAAGVMQATEIRYGIDVSDKPEAKEVSEKNVNGKITAVTGSGFTINSGGKDWTFVYDAKSRIEGTGMGTKMRELEKLGKKPTLTEFLAVNDEVSVDYTESAGTMHATEVRVIKKAK